VRIFGDPRARRRDRSLVAIRRHGKEFVVSEEIVSLNKEAARRKAKQAGKRLAGYVSEQAAAKGRAAKGKAKRAGKRAAGLVSSRVASSRDAVRRRASTAGKTAATKLLEAGIEISRKQQAALEKLKTLI
jgi:hypothetical protein